MPPARYRCLNCYVVCYVPPTADHPSMGTETPQAQTGQKHTIRAGGLWLRGEGMVGMLGLEPRTSSM